MKKNWHNSGFLLYFIADTMALIYWSEQAIKAGIFHCGNINAMPGFLHTLLHMQFDTEALQYIFLTVPLFAFNSLMTMALEILRLGRNWCFADHISYAFPLYFHSNFTEVCCQYSNWQWSLIQTRNRWQAATIWSSEWMHIWISWGLFY